MFTNVHLFFQDLAPDKLKNKVICDRHFKENHFMNYKREKLNKTNAIPTIYITAENTEIDLLLEPTSWVIKNKAKSLQSTTVSHNLNTIDIDENPSEVSLIRETEDDPDMNQPERKKMKAEYTTSPIRILNRNAIAGSTAMTQSKPALTRMTRLPTVVSVALPTKLVKVSNENYTIRQVVSSPSTALKILKQEIIPPYNSIPESKQTEPESPLQFVEMPLTSSTNLRTLETTDELKPILMDSLKQIAEIKDLLNQKQLTIQAPKSPKEEDSSNISQSHLNKVQLFNGVKRYLGPAMNALLRLELFSTPNREYKKDEKLICQELLLLGDKTFDFITEEWRLRLPAKTEVQKWLSERDTEEDDDAS